MLDEYTLDIIITIYTSIVAIFFWFTWRKRPDLVYWFIALEVYSIGNIFFIFKGYNELFRYFANGIQLIAILIVLVATFFEYISIMKKSQPDKKKKDRKFLILIFIVNIFSGVLIITFLSIFSLIDALIIVIMIMVFLITPVSILLLKIYFEQKTITRLFMSFAFLASVGLAISTIFGLKDFQWGWTFDYAFNFIFVKLIFSTSFAAPIEKRIRDSEVVYRKLSEDLEVKVIERTKQLETANKELEAFSYSASHDLKAPIRSIAGFSKAIWEDYGNKFDETNKDFLERIMKNCDKMDELIDDLLKLAQISRLEFNADNVNISILAKEIMNDLLLSYPNHHVKVILQENLFAKCDTKLMRIALENLLGNALKF